MARLIAKSFDEIPGWASDDHLVAYEAFRAPQIDDVSRPLPSANNPVSEALFVLRDLAARLNLGQQDQARAFFEANFTPHSIEEDEEKSGLITGYFEPEMAASLIKTDQFHVPIYALPPFQQRIDPDNEDYPAELPSGLNAALFENGKWSAFPTRAQVMAGDAAGAEAIAYLSDPVAAYFIHIQGSAALRLENDELLRIAYAGRNGHPYRSIGRFVIDQGYMAEGSVTYDSLVAWLRSHPEKQMDVFSHNPSYIFFQRAKSQVPQLGPVAAAGVPLTPMRSLAIDRKFHPYHLPIWVDGVLPAQHKRDEVQSFHQLMIAQDTGAAIKGVERGDVFFGRGDEMGKWAGATQHKAHFTILLPKGIAVDQLEAK